MKTKEEVEPLNKKLCELTDEQLELVTGGEDRQFDDDYSPRLPGE